MPKRVRALLVAFFYLPERFGTWLPQAGLACAVSSTWFAFFRLSKTDHVSREFLLAWCAVITLGIVLNSIGLLIGRVSTARLVISSALYVAQLIIMFAVFYYVAPATVGASLSAILMRSRWR